MNLALKLLDKLAEIAITRPEARQYAQETTPLPRPRAEYVPVVQGRFRYWQHNRCSSVLAFPLADPPTSFEDCHTCATGVALPGFRPDDPLDWQQLYVETVEQILGGKA